MTSRILDLRALTDTELELAGAACENSVPFFLYCLPFKARCRPGCMESSILFPFRTQNGLRCNCLHHRGYRSWSHEKRKFKMQWYVYSLCGIAILAENRTNSSASLYAATNSTSSTDFVGEGGFHWCWTLSLPNLDPLDV